MCAFVPCQEADLGIQTQPVSECELGSSLLLQGLDQFVMRLRSNRYFFWLRPHFRLVDGWCVVKHKPRTLHNSRSSGDTPARRVSNNCVAPSLPLAACRGCHAFACAAQEAAAVPVTARPASADGGEGSNGVQCPSPTTPAAPGTHMSDFLGPGADAGTPFLPARPAAPLPGPDTGSGLAAVPHAAGARLLRLASTSRLRSGTGSGFFASTTAAGARLAALWPKLSRRSASVPPEPEPEAAACLAASEGSVEHAASSSASRSLAGSMPGSLTGGPSMSQSSEPETALQHADSAEAALTGAAREGPAEAAPARAAEEGLADPGAAVLTGGGSSTRAHGQQVGSEVAVPHADAAVSAAKVPASAAAGAAAEEPASASGALLATGSLESSASGSADVGEVCRTKVILAI